MTKQKPLVDLTFEGGEFSAMGPKEFHDLTFILDWTRAELAQHSRRSLADIGNLMRGRRPIDQTLADWLRDVAAKKLHLDALGRDRMVTRDLLNQTKAEFAALVRQGAPKPRQPVAA